MPLDRWGGYSELCPRAFSKWIRFHQPMGAPMAAFPCAPKSQHCPGCSGALRRQQDPYRWVCKQRLDYCLAHQGASCFGLFEKGGTDMGAQLSQECLLLSFQTWESRIPLASSRPPPPSPGPPPQGPGGQRCYSCSRGTWGSGWSPRRKQSSLNARNSALDKSLPPVSLCSVTSILTARV